MTQPEQRQALVDTFINAIYLYDDKVLITFNYKEGTETVAFGEAVKAEKSSDMSARGAPQQQNPNFFPIGEGFGFFVFYGRKISIDCTGVEDALDVTMAQQTELDYLIYNDPLGYADLILNGDPKEYLKNVSGSRTLKD